GRQEPPRGRRHTFLRRQISDGITTSRVPSRPSPVARRLSLSPNVLRPALVQYPGGSCMAWWTRRKPAEETRDPQMPLIRLEGVTKIFKGDADEETRALDNVTVDIAEGEYVSVSGPSGCGKSTFLSILALLDAPTAGRYWFNGRRVDQLQPAEKARVRNVDVGLIFQSFNLIGDMTVYENVEY